MGRTAVATKKISKLAFNSRYFDQFLLPE